MGGCLPTCHMPWSSTSLPHTELLHTWPWWAFGVGLGVAILVMFGLFEKKRNEMKQIAGALRDWEW